MTSVDNLSKEIMKQLETYSKVLQEDVDEITDEVTKQAIQELKAKSPRSNVNHKHYADSWTRKKVPGGYILHNRKYQLTHLLEKGYAKVSGGRVGGRPHIGPVEQATIREFESRIEKAARG